jgi:copper chaperone CopZ
MTNTLSSREKLIPKTSESPELIFAQERDEVQGASSSASASTASSTTSKLQIIHATKGRIRIRKIDGIGNGKIDNLIFKNICQKLEQQHGVTKVSVNEETGSITVNFDERELSLTQMLEVAQDLGISKQIASATKDPFAPWKSVDFWKEQTIDLIPLFTGLAVTSGLGISGLASIPLYFVTANTTRKVIDTYKSGEKVSIKLNKQVADSASKLKKIFESKASKVERASVMTKENVVHKPPDKVVTTATRKSPKIAYNIVHSIPGRIRFNIPLVAEDGAYARRLERVLKTDSEVTNIRINSDAASVAIYYKSHNIPQSYWIGLIQSALESTPANSFTSKTTSNITPSKAESEVEIKKIQTQLQQVIQTSELDKSQQLAEELTEFDDKKDESTLQISSLWANMKVPALSYSLAAMANFKID